MIRLAATGYSEATQMATDASRCFLTPTQAMLLTGFTIAHYLLDKGYLSSESILDGRFTAHLASSRNTNYLINRDANKGSLFVKQVQAWDQEKIETLRTEATCYWLAENEAEYAQLRKFLPPYLAFDSQNHILITEAVQGAISLNDFYLQQRSFPLQLATRQAELLGSFHKTIARSVQDAPSFRLFRKQEPVVFLWSSSGFPAYSGHQSQAERQMVQLITKNEDYMTRLSAVREKWEATSLIHGDIKPANFLINQDAPSTGHYDLRLIDWETADIGDPCWDVAAIFQSYLFYWIYHEPLQGQSAQNSYASYGFSLETMQPSMRQFWQTYIRLMDWTAEEAEANLSKIVGYCALKLIHTCYETIQQASTMPLHSARLLQLSLNMLRSPDEAIWSVLGIPNAVRL
ncbi:aminoglycoside phosphotransferase family protein [Spirosoma endbachense]|uniref:aminoglycoside phosphotransferase family protein n=1 Tax=Spirosoma endbachense TaxID=2666025 RepID=UPI00139145C5|nr:aminoglycoside phosphotransferase family protein [Spirosoma endbachense]